MGLVADATLPGEYFIPSFYIIIFGYIKTKEGARHFWGELGGALAIIIPYRFLLIGNQERVILNKWAASNWEANKKDRSWIIGKGKKKNDNEKRRIYFVTPLLFLRHSRLPFTLFEFYSNGTRRMSFFFLFQMFYI